jgi:hypothetical protein
VFNLPVPAIRTADQNELNSSEVLELQTRLETLGMRPGFLDGIPGPKLPRQSDVTRNQGDSPKREYPATSFWSGCGRSRTDGLQPRGRGNETRFLVSLLQTEPE